MPAGLAAVVTRLMAKTAEGRFTGCDEVVEALEPFLGDLNQMPGGVPNAPSGARPGLGNQSSGRMPGLPQRSNPAPKVTLPSRAATTANPPASGERGRPTNPAPNVRTPGPQPARGPAGMPSRASFQLPALTDDGDTGAAARTQTPPEPARALPKLPTRGATGGRPAAPAAPPPARTKTPAPQLEAVEETEEAPAWASESDDGAKQANFGAIGIVAAALLLMVAVYFGATMLMK